MSVPPSGIERPADISAEDWDMVKPFVDMQYERDLYKLGLRKLVAAVWAEFGSDLTEGDADHLDKAYIEACAILKVAPDPRPEEEQQREREQRGTF